MHDCRVERKALFVSGNPVKVTDVFHPEYGASRIPYDCHPVLAIRIVEKAREHLERQDNETSSS